MHALDLDPQHRSLAAESHGANSQLIGLGREPALQFSQLGVGVGVVHLAKERLFRAVIGRAAIPSDGHTQHAGSAALALGLVHRIQHDLAHPSQVPSGSQGGVGQGILRTDVFTATALEEQVDHQLVAFHLLEVHGRKGLVAQVVPAVLSGERIHRVGAQVGQAGGFRHGRPDLLAQLAGAPALRVPDIEDGCTGILADGGPVLAGHGDVLEDRFHGTPGGRAGGLAVAGLNQAGFHIRGQVGGRQPDELQKVVGVVSHEGLHAREGPGQDGSILWSAGGRGVVMNSPCRRGRVSPEAGLYWHPMRWS